MKKNEENVKIGFSYTDEYGETTELNKTYKYDENYFDAECIFISLIIIGFGYVSMLIDILNLIRKYKPFTKFIYKIANIGVKK